MDIDILNKIEWPNGKNFAFTIFDDTDNSTLNNTSPVYSFLYERGFLITKSIWIDENELGTHSGQTCQDLKYLNWVKGLNELGFEIGYHMASCGSSIRKETEKSLEEFRDYFGYYPKTMANHSRCKNNIYWGDARLSGLQKNLYNLLTLGKNKNLFTGHDPGSKYFWGDICKKKIKYVRNFVFNEINTLKKCPQMPYYDKNKPFVNNWFASTNGINCNEFIKVISESNQDRLEEENGACIMYTHFAEGFVNNGELNKEFKLLMKKLSKKNGWFVPVNQLLDYLLNYNQIKPNVSRLECSWLIEKIFTGYT